MSDDPTPLDYRPPQAPPAGEVFSVAAYLASLLVAAVLAIDLLVITPHFETIFKDFGSKLPLLTLWLLSASRFMAGGGWVILVVFPLVIGFLAPFVAPHRPTSNGALASQPDRGRLRRMSLLVLLTMLAIGAILAFTIFALFLPMISLIQSVSGSGK